MTLSPYGRNGQAAFALVVHLDDAATALARGNRPEAVKILLTLHDTIKDVAEMMRVMKARTAKDAEEAQRRMDSLLITIGKMHEQEQEVKDALLKAQGSFDGDIAKLVADQQAQAKDQGRLRDLKHEIDSINEDQERAERYCLVPGYGKYAVGKLAYDGITGRLQERDNLQNDLGRIAKDAQLLSADMASMRAQIGGLSARIAALQQQDGELDRQIQFFEQQNKLMAHRAASAIEVAGVCDEMLSSLVAMSENLDLAASVCGHLTRTYTMYSQAVPVITVYFGDAIRLFAAEKDAWDRQINPNQPPVAWDPTLTPGPYFPLGEPAPPSTPPAKRFPG